MSELDTVWVVKYTGPAVGYNRSKQAVELVPKERKRGREGEREGGREGGRYVYQLQAS